MKSEQVEAIIAYIDAAIAVAVREHVNSDHARVGVPYELYSALDTAKWQLAVAFPGPEYED